MKNQDANTDIVEEWEYDEEGNPLCTITDFKKATSVLKVFNLEGCSVDIREINLKSKTLIKKETLSFDKDILTAALLDSNKRSRFYLGTTKNYAAEKIKKPYEGKAFINKIPGKIN